MSVVISADFSHDKRRITRLSLCVINPSNLSIFLPVTFERVIEDNLSLERQIASIFDESFDLSTVFLASSKYIVLEKELYKTLVNLLPDFKHCIFYLKQLFGVSSTTLLKRYCLHYDDRWDSEDKVQRMARMIQENVFYAQQGSGSVVRKV